MKSLNIDFLKAYFFSKSAHSLIRRIAWISLVSMCVSVASLILVLSIMNHLNQRVRGRLLKHEPHLIVSVPSKVSAKGFVEQMMEDSKIAKTVEQYFIIIKQDIILRGWRGRFAGAIGFFIEEQKIRAYLKKLNPDPIFMVTAHERDSDHVFIGRELAEMLGVYPADFVQIMLPQILIESSFDIPRVEQIEIDGFFESGQTDLDQKLFIVSADLPIINKIMRNTEQRREIQFWLNQPEIAEKLKLTLIAKGITDVETWQERNRAILFALRLEKALIGLFLFLAVMVSALSSPA